MTKLSSLTNFWQNIRETDLRPLRDQALGSLRLTIIGEHGSGRLLLADQIRRDPNRPQVLSDAPLSLLDLDAAHQASAADLIILMLLASKTDFNREIELVRQWQNSARRVLVFINQPEGDLPSSPTLSPWTSRGSRRVVIGSPSDIRFLLEKFAPAVLEILPDRLLALGRSFPLFRLPVARHLINDTAFSNAAYAFSTGFAEIVPVLNIPLTIADTIVLTKAQAFLVYRLGLALGFSTRWQDYVAEFSGVLGSGFVWRQIARSLIGLIPVLGIVPKTAIAYAGTYVVGNVVLQWYITGRHISRAQMSQLYTRARLQGEAIAQTLRKRLRIPRVRLPRLLPRTKAAKSKPALPAPKTRRPSRRKQTCAQCGKTNSADAVFCQYCGSPLPQTD